MTIEQIGKYQVAYDLLRVLEQTLLTILQRDAANDPMWRQLRKGPGLAMDLTVLDMPSAYERINATSIARKSPEQLRKWRVARNTAVHTFVIANGGNCLVRELDTHNAHALHRYWQARVLDGEVRINSANRLMRSFLGLYSAIHSYYRFEHKNPFSGLYLRGGYEGKRLAYQPSFVRDHILAEGALDTLNAEAQGIVHLIAETGLRPSEACALDASTICLKGEIPFVRVTDHVRQTKTFGSIRTIPLVGVALRAMQLQPNGFPRYRNRPDAASAAINKALKVNNLRPGGKLQTLYSLRHTLVDRLRAAEAPKDIQEDILGHIHMYGEGTSLEHRHAWLQRIAFNMPGQA